ncbi:ATP-binding protein [Streptomyces caelestis]|uniref:Anti-sigma regulatory factor (Ser/Thr protein kinase) n=1 Tax=Streptomyces caelestis TaxID=36816 RepID=A0A7W9HAZ6_9ACTN|nr:ATP-binding protein [Streptomyces caelestis]MBB5798937.1 anti-sigma regulatory factor (Ser/Thr protein kinase) [Streptomyces caelestis]
MTATQSPLTVHQFTMRFSSTPRGARLARRLCGYRLDGWGVPYGSDAHDVVTLVVAELSANAVRHGHVAGRDFHVLLTADPATDTVRIEVSDTRGERLPTLPVTPPEDGEDEGGRGLLLVEALADRWGCSPRAEGGPGKTVWAECTGLSLS